MRAMQEYFSCANWVKTISSELIESIFRGSNSILALEYLKALKRLESPIKPVIIPRLGASYNSPSLEGEFSSATAIRSAILSGKSWDSVAATLPIPSLEILKETISKGWGPVSIHSFDQMLLGLLRRSSTEEISNWMDVEEGLENRIKTCPRKR